MRTQKRFTPDLLDRFRRQERGTGTYQNYVAWHQVGRGDPASMGRSHLLVWRERHRELLSDGELDGSHFTTMLPNVDDAREQLSLNLDESDHELAAYDVRYVGRTFPGTLQIAHELGVKHPRISGRGRTESWVMSTDQALVLRDQRGALEMLAVAFKPEGLNSMTKRTRELLAIEAAYWAARSATWLLLTPEQFDESVALTLRRVSSWGLGTLVKPSEIELAVDVVRRSPGRSLTYIWNVLTIELCDDDLAKRAFWQSVWSGDLPMDLRRGWRPHQPASLLDQTEFWNLNPIAARRSAWI